MSAHTPGPWAVGPEFDNDGEPEIIIEHQTPFGNLVIAVALPGLQGQEANARLIAAAPELLEALQNLLAVASVRIDDPRIVQFDAARAAVAKATGETK